MMNPIWQTPPQELTLDFQDVHIWCANLDLPQEQILPLAKLLCEEEINRANRFQFEHHRHRFIAARGTLRIILGQYLNRVSDRIEFDYSPKGKPSIIASQGIEFNMSHSETLALYGVTRNRPIGVDIEYLRPMKDAAQLAKRFFCQSESEAISGLPAGEIEKTFFRAWTAKEAFLKATGEGIAGGLDQIEVDLSSQESRQFLSINGNAQEVENWSLLPLVVAENYLGAVVVKGPGLFRFFKP
ncbi:4'-phosphopantetheinyl transferase family protein [Gloeothece verrucosa]|uniref:4'-phosphopantetheinyl transferase n=1 Tax=Gloeothece verrucosa (strain PCC 7822) TaxID=497965 RepID=E0UJ89_GLOV7|nr:4'-phosphopantetheinyl transferase superfamily protein [Gloeothece verrucosa]ADN15792.1 4'-phosphopantetheinyl transferase [Gloeothece verrucosa PCC 7822]